MLLLSLVTAVIIHLPHSGLSSALLWFFKRATTVKELDQSQQRPLVPCNSITETF